MKKINTTSDPKEITLNYLKQEFGIIKNIPDVNNVFYNATPTFGEHDNPLRGLFSNEVDFKGFTLTYRSYSPTNHNGKLKEGYYVVLYHIQKSEV